MKRINITGALVLSLLAAPLAAAIAPEGESTQTQTEKAASVDVFVVNASGGA